MAVQTFASSEFLKKLQDEPQAPAEPPVDPLVTAKPFQTHLAEHPACKKDLAALATRCQVPQLLLCTPASKSLLI
jgi:hypothetical protein